MKKHLFLLVAIIMIVTSTIQAQIPTNGLIAWYPFTGNTLDSSGNNNHGINNGAMLTTDRFGKVNSAYSFDGIKSYISTNNINLKDSFTISIWVNPSLDQAGSNCCNYSASLIDNNRDASATSGYGLYYNNTTGYGLYAQVGWSGDTLGNMLKSYKSLTLNKWHQCVVRKINGSLNIYLDGKLISSKLNMKSTSQNSDKLLFGKAVWGGNLFSGNLDDIRIYNRALDSADLQALYHEGGYVGSSLPVTLDDISGLQSGNVININWHTATELNTSHFIIQKSTDGLSFTDIGTVKATGSGANGYQFTDNNPTNGINYYRLKSVDKDGSFAYSKTVSVQFTVNSNQLSVYPNPSKDKVTVRGNHIATLQVLDNLGRIVKTQTLKDATNPTLSLVNLPAGAYHLRVQTTDGKVSGVVMIKE